MNTDDIKNIQTLVGQNQILRDELKGARAERDEAREALRERGHDSSCPRARFGQIGSCICGYFDILSKFNPKLESEVKPCAQVLMTVHRASNSGPDVPSERAAPASADLSQGAISFPAPVTIRAEGSSPNRGDWTEDFSHENGNYFNKCITCGDQFSGHKRRVVCKLCASPAPDVMAAETPRIEVTQRLIDRIVARAQNSLMSIGDPETSYSLDNYADKSLESVALILVTAHHAKYDLVSLMLAAMEEIQEAMGYELAAAQAQNAELAAARDALEKELALYKLHYESAVEAVEPLRSQVKQLGLTPGDNLLTHGVRALIKQRDALAREVAGLREDKALLDYMEQNRLSVGRARWVFSQGGQTVRDVLRAAKEAKP